jgi:hypothetical protein
VRDSTPYRPRLSDGQLLQGACVSGIVDRSRDDACSSGERVAPVEDVADRKRLSGYTLGVWPPPLRPPLPGRGPWTAPPPPSRSRKSPSPSKRHNVLIYCGGGRAGRHPGGIDPALGRAVPISGSPLRTVARTAPKGEIATRYTPLRPCHWRPQGARHAERARSRFGPLPGKEPSLRVEAAAGAPAARQRRCPRAAVPLHRPPRRPPCPTVSRDSTPAGSSPWRPTVKFLPEVLRMVGRQERARREAPAEHR